MRPSVHPLAELRHVASRRGGVLHGCKMGVEAWDERPGGASGTEIA
jgi:hypothetical protein